MGNCVSHHRHDLGRELPFFIPVNDFKVKILLPRGKIFTWVQGKAARHMEPRMEGKHGRVAPEPVRAGFFCNWDLRWSVLALRSWADENTPSEISSVESVTFSCLLLPSCYNLAPASHKNFFAFLPSSVLLLYVNTSERYWAIRGGCEPVGQEECFEI